jgi:hypothetical protein
MTQIFHPSTNTLSKVSIFGAVFILAAVGGVMALIYRSPYMTQVNVAQEQPIPFSHKHHVGGLGIDCRFCHTTVDSAAFAGIPSTKTCMNCHSQIWADSPTLQKIRESFRTNTPIEWIRVHDLPDFVYFDHSIHIKKGVACVTCHGRVDQMPLTWREKTLHMTWCLDCHRHPERYVRPREQVFNMNWRPSEDQISLGKKLVKKYNIQKLTDCSICHR